ncbi:ABC transporter substrate-binding protein [Streptomyces pyxinae]|uniref:ABC transporter substrate-binding protein n=1 Tax=Streptomyces pyxinae TaxID=2970734 RepID=UPI003D178C3F
MRRLLSGALLPLLLFAAGCSGSSSAADDHRPVLRVGDQKGGAEAVLRAAGELDDLPYRITWSTFTSGPPLLEAVDAGAIDIGGVGNTPPVFAAGAGSKIAVVSASHGAAAGEAVLVPEDSPLRRTADLKGKRVAVAQGSSAHYQLLASLRKAGLSLKDVDLTLLQPADALAAFTSGKVDAWAVWDPYTSQVLQSGRGRILTTGDGVVNGLSFQVAAPAALADRTKAGAVGDFVERLRRAQDWVFRHPEEWAKVWAKETGLPYEVALAAVRRSHGTRIAVALDRAAIASEQEIADTFAGLGLIPRRFDFADYVDTRFNKNLPPSTTPARTYGKDSPR